MNDYDIVTAGFRYDLIKAVKKRMQDGWIPVGGHLIDYDAANKEDRWTQAMIMEQ